MAAEQALMSPYYSGYAPRDRCILNQDDIDNIRELYGVGGTGSVDRCGPSVAFPEAFPRLNLPAGAPDPCNMPIDAMWTGLDYHFYVVRGQWLFRVKSDGQVMEVNKTRYQFARFPNRPDAAAYR